MTAAKNRLDVLRRFIELREHADPELAARIESHIAYLRALLGERTPLDEYMRATQGCTAAGWPREYVTHLGETLRSRLDDLGIAWGESTLRDLLAAEGLIEADAAPDAIRQAAAEVEPAVRRLVDTDAPYRLNIEATDVQAYWAYWLDGSGADLRLRLNLRHATFTKVTVRQFALHEVLGHGLKAASYTARGTNQDVPWVRLLSVHSPHQILLEGLAQTLPLFVTPDDDAVLTRVKLEHYSYLVRSELHLAINTGTSVEECADHARDRIPWWTDDAIGDALTDRSADPLLRSYLWAYPAGQDWFTHLSNTDPEVWRPILRAAYRSPLTTTDLVNLWPNGPTIGGRRNNLE
ncbi:MAG: hypothetical protein ACRDT6_05270 [Micromonosporaceae bacterium]